MPYINVDVDINIDDIMDEVSNEYLLKEVQKRNLHTGRPPLNHIDAWDALVTASDLARAKLSYGLADRLDHLRLQMRGE